MESDWPRYRVGISLLLDGKSRNTLGKHSKLCGKQISRQVHSAEGMRIIGSLEFRSLILPRNFIEFFDGVFLFLPWGSSSYPSPVGGGDRLMTLMNKNTRYIKHDTEC